MTQGVKSIQAGQDRLPLFVDPWLAVRANFRFGNTCSYLQRNEHSPRNVLVPLGFAVFAKEY